MLLCKIIFFFTLKYITFLKYVKKQCVGNNKFAKKSGFVENMSYLCIRLIY